MAYKSTTKRPHEVAAEHADLQLLREREAAELLAVCPKTLRGWRVFGGQRGPPFVKLTGNGAIRYRLRDLAAYIDANTKTSSSEY